MPDLATISTLLGSVKTATEIAKLLKDSDLSLEKAESKLKLAELISLLADAKIELSQIQSLLIEKDKEIENLKKQLNVNNNVTWDPPYYWVQNGGTKEGPYCQNCYDSENKLIRLQGNGEGYWDCKKCGNGYKDKNYKSFVGVVRTRSSWDGY